MVRLNAKVALVTGAARGIGEAIARAYVREGARVPDTSIRNIRAELGDNERRYTRMQACPSGSPSHYLESVCLSSHSKRGIMCGHDGVDPCCVFPQQSRGKVDRVKRAELSRHRLRRSIKNNPVDLDQFQ